ncbi:MAG TPA: hypothetical protein VNT75_20180 [Symbiobacteriaceae bacterium]|nr:hypothetical protein [Symbiobacteriaceae bacterium]
MLVYRARLERAAAAVISVTVRVGRPAPGLGAGRPARCRVVVRYAAAPDGALCRHRGAFAAQVPPGAALRVAGWQADGPDLLVSFAVARPTRGEEQGAAVGDRFTLPIGLQAWGVTAVTGVGLNLLLHCRERQAELILRGMLRLTLQTPGGPFHQQVPFLRLVAAGDLPPGLRWRVYGGVTELRVQVAPGGLITGEVQLAVRCEGRPRPAPQAKAPSLQRVREVTGRIAGLTAEPAGDGLSVVRGALEVDLYGVDAAGLSRWSGRTLPFSALLPVAGDRLEPFARVERLSHRSGTVEGALEVGVTALCAETMQMGSQLYRFERIAGTAATTVVLTDESAPKPGAHPEAERKETFLPLPSPAGGWGEVAVTLHAPAPRHGRWTVKATLSGSPPLHTGGNTTAEAVIPALLRVDTAGLHLRTVLLPSLSPRHLPRTQHGEPHHLPLPGPTQAVIGLSLTDSGEVTALIKTSRWQRIEGRIASKGGRPVAATAFPVLHGDDWRMCIIVTHEKPLDSNGDA